MLRRLVNELRLKQQRLLLRLQGGQRWAHGWLASQIEFVLKEYPKLEVVRFVEHPDKNRSINQIHDFRLKQFQKLLGQECDLLVFDAYAGFNPDALGALSGTIRAGGLCILITPEDKDWGDYIDPECQRFCIEPYKPEQLTRRYIRRLCRQFSNHDSFLSVTEANRDAIDVSNLNLVSAKLIQDNLPFGCLNQQQLYAVQKILSLHSAPQPGVLVLTADRGRGKSAALGLASAQLLGDAPNDGEQTFTKILITSPSPASTVTVFKHLCMRLKFKSIRFERKDNKVLSSHFEFAFVAPDELSLFLPDADLVLIDEAAAIPQQMLSPVIDHYKHLVFATTVHGYEGTGRGFEYKLKPQLKLRFASYRELKLEIPIRFAQNDNLEPIVNRLLGLDIELPAINNIHEINSMPLKFECLALHNNQESLSQFEDVFGLLVNAHYRTTPNDFRYMLDGPNLQLFTVKQGGQLVAASLVAYEGNLDETLNEAIWRGTRRPRGHLFPQSLMAHAGFKDAGEFQFARVIRIAVHPDVQNEGIGSQLLRQLEQFLKEKGTHFLCTSFGASQSLIGFWRKNGLDFVRLGVKAEASTGEYSAMMMKPLAKVHEGWYKKVSARFYQNISIENKLKLRSKLTFDIPLFNGDLSYEAVSEQDRSDVNCFAHHYRTLDTCLAALYRCYKGHQKYGQLPLLHEKLINKLSHDVICQNHRLVGEKVLIQSMRLEAIQLL